MNPLAWSLVAGPLTVILLVSALFALAWLAAGRNAPGRGFLRRGAGRGSAGGAVSARWLAIGVPLIVMAAGGVTAVLTWLINNVWRPFPDLLPFTIVFWSWVALAGLALAVARAPWLDPKPVFTGIRTVTELVAKPGQTLESIWHPPRGMPTAGAVYQVSIPGVRSGFAARPGYLYLPPAYLAAPRPQLPVLVLLAGQPGDPRAWLDSGQLQAMMDGFAKQHDGLAPVVVMPDDLGSEFANPLCLNSRLGEVQTYLTVDVPDWITSHLQVRPPRQGWAIAGFSQGGTCAIQLSTQAPRLYRFFVDISGQAEPTLGSRHRTISRAFGGDAAAFGRVNPTTVLARTRFPRSAGVFMAGANDHVYTPQQRTMYLQARH